MCAEKAVTGLAQVALEYVVNGVYSLFYYSRVSEVILRL